MIWHAEWSIPLRWLSPPADQRTASHSARKLSKISALNTKFIDRFVFRCCSFPQLFHSLKNEEIISIRARPQACTLAQQMAAVDAVSPNCCQFLHCSPPSPNWSKTILQMPHSRYQNREKNIKNKIAIIMNINVLFACYLSLFGAQLSDLQSIQ